MHTYIFHYALQMLLLNPPPFLLFGASHMHHEITCTTGHCNSAPVLASDGKSALLERSVQMIVLQRSIAGNK